MRYAVPSAPLESFLKTVHGMPEYMDGSGPGQRIFGRKREEGKREAGVAAHCSARVREGEPGEGKRGRANPKSCGGFSRRCPLAMLGAGS